MMRLTDSLGDHVPQVPQHCHERKRLIVYTKIGPGTVFNTVLKRIDAIKQSCGTISNTGS